MITHSAMISAVLNCLVYLLTKLIVNAEASWVGQWEE